MHRYQESDVSCGVAAFQMALEHAGYEAPPASSLADELDIDLGGTRPQAMERALRTRGITHVVWHGDVTLGDLTSLLDDHAVIVCYQSKELRVGHFALVDEIRSDEVQLMDPWFGPCKCVPVEEFLETWASHPADAEPLVRWMLAVRQR